jgi:hypothetical protein
MKISIVLEDAMARARDQLSAIKRGEKPPGVRLSVVIGHSLIAGTLFVVLLSAFLYLGWYVGNRLQQIIACSVPFLSACGYVFVVFLTTKHDP